MSISNYLQKNSFGPIIYWYITQMVQMICVCSSSCMRDVLSNLILVCLYVSTKTILPLAILDNKEEKAPAKFKILQPECHI